MSVALHRVYLPSADGGTVATVRARIEQKLGVETRSEPAGNGGWAVYFTADHEVDLDFLRPDILPPRKAGDTA